ncbi:hypothetical protein CCMA1212_000271 [Trichoderma ghanense]|uniref:polynucleotide adenylyltransferase n=1 Tax=Trichoderma ghanense TaxID=65468 RepID=A0ABY2HHF5_9HYPO
MVRNKPQRRNEDRSQNSYGNGRNRHAPRRSPPRFSQPRDRPYNDSYNRRNGDRQGDRRPEARPRPYGDDRAGGGDSYRPNVPQGDFTFRVQKPAGIANSAPAGQPSYPRGPRRDARGGRGDGGPRRGGRPRWQPPPHHSERALIAGNATNLPEESLYNGEGAKYRDLDELSDDDERDMDISSQSETEEPAKKRTRTAAADESGDAAPKWSNPDPYTALPCPDESTRKKRDVVKLIRKARLEENAAKPAAPTEAEDFLSFDFSDDDNDAAQSQKSKDENKAAVAPKPPAPPPERVELASSKVLGKLPPTPPPPPPPPPQTSASSSSRPLAAGINTHSLPPKPVAPQGSQDPGPLGSRKRTYDDEIIEPPDYKLNKGNMGPSRGNIVPEWRAKDGEERCPWVTTDHSATTDMALRLHKEIMDFYWFVKPRDFEEKIRAKLVDNLRLALKRDGRNFANAQLFPFGSFVSGLYLPTADMDVVVCSESFIKGGDATYLSAKNWLYKFRKLLTSQRIANYDSIEVIAHARIPLVKFVDKATGLRVDVSFENLGGVRAVETFQRWKKEYPAMPALVTIIKHFLLMRGLNEPVNGGLGGFTVICLVVSMLQLMPEVQSGSLIPEHHLGEMFLEFLKLYGRDFSYRTNAISLVDPVGYIPKKSVSSFVYRNTERLSIIDPNNPANDIAGSSSNMAVVQRCFVDALRTMQNRMFDLAADPSSGNILEALFAGDYSSFRKQRAYLQLVHDRQTRGRRH